VFKGTYRHRIDPKGRLPVPAAFRRTLGPEPAVIVTALEQCLAAYPPGEWARLESQLGALPAFSKPVKALTRLLLSRAVDCELDGQGRILLPSALRESAGLGREAVVVGVLNRFEIWSPDSWEGFVRESERLLDDISLDIQWPLPLVTPTETVPTPSGLPTGTEHPQAKLKRELTFGLTAPERLSRLRVDFCGEEWSIWPTPSG
jgi:MraZ protein